MNRCSAAFAAAITLAAVFDAASLPPISPAAANVKVGVSARLASVPVMAAPDIVGRVTALVARIKARPNYTEAIGQSLGLIGAEETIDLNALKLALTLTLQASHPNIGSKKQGMDGLEIQVDRGAGFTFLALDTIPDYLDTVQLPAASTSAVWKYNRLCDEQVGQWSDVASMSVMG